MIITQAIEMFIAAYRELNARMIFWLAIVLNLVAVAMFATIGNNSEGLTILHWTIEFQMLSTTWFTPAQFYLLVFYNVGIAIWLTWIATILALVSTSTIFPDMVIPGSVETLVSKPISRWRLFLTRYLTGMLFVLVQVSILAFGCWLVIGIRGSSWQPTIFLSIPIVLAFFSYLFCVCALIGVITRSTIASLLLTILFWFLLFCVNITEASLQMIRVNRDLTVESLVLELEEYREKDPDDQRADRIESLEDELAERRESQETWHLVTDIAFTVKTVLPKTDETIELLERDLVPDELIFRSRDDDENEEMYTSDRVNRRQIQRRMVEERRGRSVGWILGTSFAFEAVILLIAMGLFARRDY